MGNIRDLGRTTFRDFSTDGVPSSGAHEPRKRDVREIFDVIDAAVAAFAELEAIGPIAVIKSGLTALNSDLAHGSGTLAAVITTNDEVAGIYEKSGSSGSGSWTLRMLFATVSSAEFSALVGDLADAVADIASLQSGKASASSVATLQGRADALEGRADDVERRANYVATSITGTPNALVLTTGKSLSALVAGMTISFRATPGANTSSTVTAEVDGTGAQPVKRGNGSDLRPNDLLGKQWQQTFEWTGNAWRLISSSQAVELTDAVGPRDDDGLVVTDANDVVPFEIEPTGRPAMPAILAENVSGVSASWLRQQHLSTVSRMAMCVAFLGYGQSNELANKADEISTLRSGRNMRMFVAGVRAFAGGGTPAENRASLVPHVEAFVAAAGDTPDRGETNRFGTAESFFDLIETEDGLGDWASRMMSISASSGEGSTTIAELNDPEKLDRFALDVEAAAGFADSLFDETLAVPGIDYNQVEGDVNAETPADEWLDQMVAMQATLEAITNEARGGGDLGSDARAADHPPGRQLELLRQVARTRPGGGDAGADVRPLHPAALLHEDLPRRRALHGCGSSRGRRAAHRLHLEAPADQCAGALDLRAVGADRRRARCRGQMGVGAIAQLVR